jgi:hypothetical protein
MRFNGLSYFFQGQSLYTYYIYFEAKSVMERPEVAALNS